MTIDESEARLVKEANQWLDAQVKTLKKRPFAELAKLPRTARLDSPPRLKSFRFTISRQETDAEGGVLISVRWFGRRGVVGWEFREFEKYPNESFDAASMPKPHSVADVARDIGRFECRLRPAEVGVHSRPSEMSLIDFNKLGFQQASEIHAFASRYMHEPKDLSARELGRLGQRHGGGWRLGASRPETEALWKKLLDTAMPMVLQAPDNPSWLARCVAKLHKPIVFVNSELIAEELKFTRRMIASHDEIVLLTLGLYRDDISFCGRGPIFEAALSAALARGFEQSHFTDFQRKQYQEEAMSVLPRKRR